MVSRSAEVPVVGVIAIRALADGGLVAEKVIVQGTCSSNCVGQVPSQLLPDGMGGLLITANWRVAGRDAEIREDAGQIGAATLRSLDAIHLATALAIDDEVEFITYDERLATAAREHRLRVVQPGRT